ncbi:hypothetical protein [Natronorubrum tibetense]|uniref:Uncharacterized protein n=1 Tax=Natronorubrum tibetense GA33 TaxID=1114856 RepID=L9W8I1_9EURY|nr:hypothetical protein [Natronorubrum tibetense]ELY44628.1 hypothetical protein C496_04510 [Natronorubrum tibetense GA33]
MTDTHTTRLTLIVIAVVVATLVTIPLFGASVTAADGDDPETANEYFETFRAMEGVDAYEEYDELETIRTYAVSQTQETGTLDDDERDELAAVLATMTAFERAYTEAEDGSYEESLGAAEETGEAISELETHEQTQATLADLALTRFYETLGDGLHDDVEAAERTPERIDLLSMTATAYERANMPEESAEFNLQAEQLTAEYDGALEEIETAESDSESFLETCADCTEFQAALVGSTNPLETFENYRSALDVSATLGDAEDEAATHGLEEREEALAAAGSDVGDARLSLALASSAVLIGYGTVVGLFGAIVVSRIFSWRRTYDRAQIGSVVTAGENDV